MPLCALVVVASCDRAQPPAVERYTCPMHRAYVSDRPGDCPVCGMRLVPLEKAAAPAPPRKPLYYRSPMDPHRTSPVPKKDEMGMDYVPVYAEAADGGRGAPGYGIVEIAPERQRLIGLRTVEVKRGVLGAELRVNGRVLPDETRVHKVTARFDGYVEKLQADFTGKFVQKGAPLASIYSPELLATEEEYLLARRSESELAKSGLPSMAESARTRLRLYGISDQEITRLERRGSAERALTLTAPVSGYVMQKSVTAGSKVGPNDPLFEIVDLSRLWVVADVYERDLPRLRLAMAATVTLPYWPARLWRGKVSFIYPAVDDKTRTVKVRIDVDNPGGELKPDMFADVVLAAPSREALLLPEDALLETGTRKLVFVEREPGKLEPREVSVGLHAGGVYEVVRGLDAGERVATGASFLLDSESRLKAAVGEAPKP